MLPHRRRSAESPRNTDDDELGAELTASYWAAYDERIAGGLVPMGRWGTAEDVGRAVAAIASGGLPYSTGSVIDVDGGLGLISWFDPPA